MRGTGDGRSGTGDAGRSRLSRSERMPCDRRERYPLPVTRYPSKKTNRFPIFTQNTHMHLSEILNHLGEDRELYFNAVSPPIIQSSNFAFDSLAKFREAFADELNHHIYTRGNNPTVAILRKKLAALEGTDDALVFSSGSGAIANAVIANVKAGDHVVCVRNPYSWTNALLTKFLPRFGVTSTFVDGRNIKEIENAIQSNSTVLMLESPNSVTFELQDLAACATLAKKHQLISIIDNSYCSPLFQRPADFGIDLVVHSGTKYLNGHSDVVNGVICGSQELINKIFQSELMTLGGIVSPHDAALILRGLRTLELRMQRSDESTRKIVARLEQHPKVREILYPFAESFSQKSLAHQQMKGAGGLFSILIDVDSITEAEAFFNRLNNFLLAVSWGGHESLVIPFCTFYGIPGKPDTTIPFNLFRFYIGLEDPDWLLEDIEQALAGIN